MTDLLFLLVVVLFFAIAIALVRACEAMLGADDTAPEVKP